MEFTEMKKCLFGGYKKDDVVKYISELNEEHSLELNSKSESYAELKGITDAKLSELTYHNKRSADKISELEQSIEKLNTELTECMNKYNTLKADYEAMDKETAELREKSDIISTAIINAEKCAGRLLDEANENANGMISRAEKKVEVETSKLGRAKDYISRAREEVMEVLRKIDSELKATENNLESKKNNILNPLTSDVDSAEKFGIIPKGPWNKRA